MASKKNYSTTLTVSDVVDNLIDNLDNKKILVPYFLTSQKHLTQLIITYLKKSLIRMAFGVYHYNS